MNALPIIDVSPLVNGADASRVARELDRACRELGFFYVVGHGVDEKLQAELERLSRAFFALPEPEKSKVAMARGGRAWRGWFPLGGELTSGRPDLKEGIYFGQELGPDDPRVRAGLPLHGPNLFPELAGFREAVLAYMQAVAKLGHTLMRGLALGLQLPPDFFDESLREPTVLFRIFNYPSDPQAASSERWGVGEHTDYGVLTLLKQDDCGGLQVRTPSGWLEAPPIANAFVCNLGDMLERMTGGLYRSTPHRVCNVAGRDRLSWPLFFDPSWDAPVRPIAIPEAARVQGDRSERWDGKSVFDFRGTYGEYLLGKVSKVFPELATKL
ncbi:MAG: isopenicillin N synthase family oxygenase [Deltaproteobacteria bacterium]|nr:isopenicillin N synthase family oxygenase [Deltaproteobacteria bacterium]